MREASTHEEMELLRELMAHLKPRDARRLQALIDFNGDRKAAAESLGKTHVAYSRQLRQTVIPAIRQLERERQNRLGDEE